MRGACPLRPRGIYARTIVPAPTDAGAPPRAPGDFLPDEKVTKESPRGDTPLGTPPEGDASLPPSDPDRFATLRKVSKLVLFSPRGWQGSHLLLSGRGAVGGLRGAGRLGGVAITICSHRYDTFTATNDQTFSLPIYYYHYLFYIKRVSFVTVSQQMAYLCGLLVILGVIPA